MTEENSNKQLEELKNAVTALWEGDSSQEETKWLAYGVDTEEGKQLLAAFSDGELLEHLKNTARRLGHSPSQGEVHWILREYLKKRFRNWPGALRAAGLSRSAGAGGVSPEEQAGKEEAYRQMLTQVRTMAERLGRMPHPSELPELCRKLKKRYRTWGEVLAAAGVEEAVATGLEKEENPDAKGRDMLEELGTIAARLNRAPLRSEVPESLRQNLLERFGSWRNALYQIDLEPVRRITPFVNAPLHRGKDRKTAAHRQELYDCHYRLLKLDPQTAEDLERVRKLAGQLGRVPERREVPPEVRMRLQKACGSWSNALFQLDLQEKP